MGKLNKTIVRDGHLEFCGEVYDKKSGADKGFWRRGSRRPCIHQYLIPCIPPVPQGHRPPKKF